MIGETIAHYTVTEKIGAGGMGEVYRARDEKLNRDVALKILPRGYAADKERMGRFQREARLLASLNHTNIAAIYGLEHAGDTHALVLELVAGDDLSAAMRARSFNVEEALEIAVQIAEALDFAHDAGIVHRDLKPSNVKVTPDGKVKVLDFGLAKAFLEDAGDNSDDGLTMSPTLSIAASAAGVILGTAAYMSPEQARGKKVDRRADIWAFGVLLFEMLSGKQLFAGETISDTLASVIKDAPDWSLLPADTPPLVVDVLRRCLEKNPRQRLQSIGEARIALEESLRGSGNGPASVSLLSSSLSQATVDALPQEAAPTRAWRTTTLLWVLALVVVAAGSSFLSSRLGRTATTTPARLFHLQPEGLQVGYPTQPTMSPTGQHVAYFSQDGLRIRDLQTLDSVMVPGTGLATAPFWSPDGAWVAFGMQGRLYKIAARGGTPSVVCDMPFGTLDGGAWGEDGMLYLAPNSGPLYMVSDRGGDPVPLFAPGDGESDYHTPSVLPGARGVLFTTHSTEGRNTIEVFADGERKTLLKIPTARLEYAAWSALPGSKSKGHLVFHRMNNNTGIWALPFDLDSFEVTGDPFLLDSDGTFPSVARDGSLLYVIGSGGGPQQLVFVNRKGEILQRIGQPQTDMSDPRVSPDGRAVLVSSVEGEGRDIWMHDVTRGTRTRMTFSNELESAPGWAQDGRDIYFSQATVSTKTYMRPADGTGEPRLVADGYQLSYVEGVPYMAFTRFLPGSGQDLFYQAVGSDDTARVFLQTSASEVGAQISPDGRFVVYMSDESGSNEVYMKPFPTGEGKWQVSTEGGAWPRWNRDGGEIVFRSGSEASARLMSVTVETSPRVRLGTPVALFSAQECPTLVFRTGFAAYDATPDPDKLLMLEFIRETAGPTTRLVFCENWRASFRRTTQ